MSIKVMTAVWARAPYKGSDLLTLLALADWADDVGICWPWEESIAKKSRQSHRNAQRTLKQLRDDGYIILLRQATRREPGKYQINLAKLRSASDIDTTKSREISDYTTTGCSEEKDTTICRVNLSRQDVVTSGVQRDDNSDGFPRQTEQRYKEEPSGTVTTTEPAAADADGQLPLNPDPIRYKDLIAAIDQAYLGENRVKCPWAGRAFKALQNALKGAPTWGHTEWARCVSNRFASSRERVNLGEAPEVFIPKLKNFINGPVEKFGGTRKEASHVKAGPVTFAEQRRANNESAFVEAEGQLRDLFRDP